MTLKKSYEVSFCMQRHKNQLKANITHQYLINLSFIIAGSCFLTILIDLYTGYRIARNRIVRLCSVSTTTIKLLVN